MYRNWAGSLSNAQIPVSESDNFDWSSDGSAPPTVDYRLQAQRQSFDSLTEGGTVSETLIDLNPSNLGEPSAVLSGRGSRFSPSALLVLRAWFAAHYDHPYPSAEDFEVLQRQTGLKRLQISTWFANARRRAKPKTKQNRRADSPAPQLVDNTYMLGQPQDLSAMMSPLQRWRDSPPEHEPAQTSDISRALSRVPYTDTSSNSPYSYSPLKPSRCASSAGSAGTSESAVSTDSVHSCNSAFSADSARSPNRSRRRRRRRQSLRPRPTAKKLGSIGTDAEQPSIARTSHTLIPFPDTFQCTFCTQTFKTKHNWQRHEKSLHLSLEAWECSPEGPLDSSSPKEVTCCVYCGEPDPDEGHLASHNHQACSLRPANERTFFRKDHLIQHLRLVHRSAFVPEIMLRWKFEHKDIRSRCGFCDRISQSWADRMDHLADHFKQGWTMAQWKGGWGFEPAVLDMVESSMQPYLIEFERKTPAPFEAGHPPPRGPSTAYDLLHLELESFSSAYVGSHSYPPTISELQFEACQVIFAAEILWNQDKHPESWLYDLLTSSEAIANRARNCSAKDVASMRPTELRIHGKRNMFEDCNLESALRERVLNTLAIHGEEHVEDEWLQEQAKEIVLDMNSTCQPTTGVFSDFLIGLINDSTEWLAPFRLRAAVPMGYTTMLTSEAKALHDTHLLCLPIDPEAVPAVQSASYASHETVSNTNPAGELGLSINNQNAITYEKGVAFLDHSNYYRELVHNLTRFIASSTSARNPTRHIPSDEELQRQARWIMYDDDDPWNQTPADNPDWLRDFKRSVGLHVDD